jgi:hypothetical protein
MGRPWTEVAAAKCAEREAHIKNHSRSRTGPSAYAQVTQIDNVAALTDLLEKGLISAEDVVVAHIEK